MARPATSVLIPSSRRPQSLRRCLLSLEAQLTPPSEVIVAWQGTDSQTRDCACEFMSRESLPLRAVHCEEVGIVPAENAALDRAQGDIIFLIDDDAVAPPDWIARHLSHYGESSVGGVGGPFDNFHPNGSPFPKRARQPVGKLTWYGKAFGNMFDHDPSWRSRPPQDVDHLIGSNLSLRRGSFDRYDDRLKPYWQMHETDVCLQVKSRGYRLLFDFNNVVRHYPSSEYATPGRAGNLELKIYNAAYNNAFVLSKHSPQHLRAVRLLYCLAVGSVAAPGLLASAEAIRRYGNPRREASILARTWKNSIAGWRDGAKARADIQANGTCESP